MSVDAEFLLAEMGVDWQFSLRDHPGYSLVRLGAQAARITGLIVENDPEPDNPAHTLVRGKKTGRVIAGLKDASSWAHVGETPLIR